MRTTIHINDALARRVRALAAQRGTSMRALVEEGLRRVLDERRPAAPFRLRDASAGEGGLAAGVDDASWETLSRFLYPRPS
ncbi:MAG TPA: ribbon-helix-helix protein, CopG family [Polyangia bacterium]|jgi:hypothetical protein